MTLLLSSENTSQRFFKKKYINHLILFICWASVQTIILFQYGIFTDLEAKKYITEAQHLIDTGTVSTPNFWLYAVQIFIIAAAIKLKTGFVSVYVVQLLFNVVSTFVFYHYLRRVTSVTTGLIVTLLLIFNFPFQTFNSFLQTESLFFSLSILFSCYLLSIQKLSVRNLLQVLLFLFVLCFTRPTGCLFIPGTFLYIFFHFFKRISTIYKLIITGAGTILFFWIANAAMGSGGELDFMLPFRDERIICGVPTLSQFVEIKTGANPNSLYGLLYYIINNPEQFIRLTFIRSKAFWGLTRSYFSSSHNIFLIVYFYPLYILSFIAILKYFKKEKTTVLYCISIIGTTWLTVILTCDDWHNRFFLSITPYIYILSSFAIHYLFLKKKGNVADKGNTSNRNTNRTIC